MKFIEQYDESDCGPACLAMLSQYYGKKTVISRIRQWSKTDKEGTTLYGLIKAGEYLGLNLTGFSTDNIEDIKKSKLPVLVHIINEQGFPHFIIIEKRTKNKFHIIDPAKGKEKINFSDFESKWTGVLILVQNNPSINYDENIPSKINVFKQILKNNKFIIMYVFVLSVIINFLGIAGAFYYKYLVDSIIPSNILKKLHIISIAVLLLYIIHAFISFLRYQVSLKLSLKIDIDFMKNYYYHVLNLPVNFYERRKSGEILSRFSDLSKIREALSSVTITLLVDTLMVIVGGSILFYQSSKLFMITLVLIPIYLVIGFSFRKTLERYSRLVMEQEATLSSFLIESFSGYQIIKSLIAENKVFKKGVNHFNDLLKKIYKLDSFINIQLTINEFMKLTTTLIILWAGSSMIIKNELSLGELLTFNALVIYYIDPIERLINLQPQIQSAVVATQRYLDIIDIKSEEESTINDKERNINKFEKAIEIENLSFQYNFEGLTLKNINMLIPKNKTIGIVGESGSGKSTLAKLIDNFDVNYDGNIKIDNISTKSFSKESLRTLITFVTQEKFIFGATIRDNLTIGLNKIVTDEEIYKACKISCAYDFIINQPQKLDTQLHNGGSNLSGGQLQRISLARAILRDSDILILDEATNSLDNATEKEVLNNIEKHMTNKTVILITHKLSNIKDANNIYVLKYGEIIEQGKHEVLLKNKKEYYRLWANEF